MKLIIDEDCLNNLRHGTETSQENNIQIARNLNCNKVIKLKKSTKFHSSPLILNISYLIFASTILTIIDNLIYTKLSCNGQQNPSIVQITPGQSVDLGDTVDLSCSVQYGASYPIIWTKLNPNNSPLFISRDAALSVLDNRYSIRHDDSSSTYTLQISKIQETDTGNYQCQVVTSPTSRITSDTFITVRIPPLLSDNTTRAIVAGIGETFSLQCYATGFPMPKISWRRENNGLLPTGGVVEKGNTITIYNATKDDRGIYFCIADNGVGKPARRSVGVEIEFPPQVSRVSAIYYQAIGYPVELHCSIEASPQPDISWLKDGYQINNDNSYHQIVSTSSNDFIQTTLRIMKVEQRDFGRYRCRAINKLGDRQIDVELQRTSNPVCPPACVDGEYQSISTSSGSSHRFTTISNELLIHLLSMFLSMIAMYHI